MDQSSWTLEKSPSNKSAHGRKSRRNSISHSEDSNQAESSSNRRKGRDRDPQRDGRSKGKERLVDNAVHRSKDGLKTSDPINSSIVDERSKPFSRFKSSKGSTSLSSSIHSETSSQASSFDFLSTPNSPHLKHSHLSEMMAYDQDQGSSSGSGSEKNLNFSSQVSPQNLSSPESVDHDRFDNPDLVRQSQISDESGSGSGSSNPRDRDRKSNSSSDSSGGRELHYPGSNPDSIESKSSSRDSEGNEEELHSNEEMDYLRVRKTDSVRSISDESQDSVSEAGSHLESGNPPSPKINSSQELKEKASQEENQVDHDDFLSAKLVTIHLYKSKTHSGIWPVLIKDGLPLQVELELGLESTFGKLRMNQVQDSLNRALKEALHLSHQDLDDDDDEETEMDDEENSYSDSESGGSETVLGPRRNSRENKNRISISKITEMEKSKSEGEVAQSSEESLEKFNCDSISLALLGQMNFNNGRTSNSRADEEERELDLSFQYFSKSWKLGGVSLSIRRLVEDYLPLLEGNDLDSITELVYLFQNWSGGPDSSLKDFISKSRSKVEIESRNGSSSVPMNAQGSSDTLQPHRNAESTSFPSHNQSSISLEGNEQSPREAELSKARKQKINLLGGSKGLAKLYLSYARLDLNAAEDLSSPLAFPGNGLIHNPFDCNNQSSRTKCASTSLKKKSSSKLGLASSSSPDRTNNLSIPSSPNSLHSNILSDSESESNEQLDYDFGPLPFLIEAIKLDETIQGTIKEEELMEAFEIAQISLDQIQMRNLEGYTTSSRSNPRSNTSNSLPAFSDDGLSEGDRKRRRSKSRKNRRTKDGDEDEDGDSRIRREKRKARRNRTKNGNHQDVYDFVSATALISVASVALAGGVAAISWWRRTGGTGN